MGRLGSLRPWLAVLAGAGCLAACGAEDSSDEAGNSALSAGSAIEHVVLIVQENHTFDAYYGRYCTAPSGSNPACTTGPECCEAAPATVDGHTTGHGLDPMSLTD